MAITPLKWTAIEPSVIRDAVSGRLGFQEQFGTTYVSGATNSLALKQNPIDGSVNEGDALLYIGTTNGGLYVRSYDYQSDRWSDSWTWLSRPSGSTSAGYNGAQGVASLALSPDGSLIAAGRGNSSNFKAYTPSGPSLQIGQIQADGSVDWLPVVSQTALSGQGSTYNVRSLLWQDDALYASFYNDATNYGEIGRFVVDGSGATLSYERLGTTNSPILTATAGNADPVFFGTLTGNLFRANPDNSVNTPVSGEAWQQVVQTRLGNSEFLGRLVMQSDPQQPDGYVMLAGWFNIQKGNIAHVDRLTMTADGVVSAVDSIDLAGLAGSGQANVIDFYGNYTLAFDPQDESLDSVLVGGNQYLSAHPVDAQPYASTGGLIRANFTSGAVEPIFGPYQDESQALIPESLLIGAPHADSRLIVTLMTPNGEVIIQGDDGGVWQLSENPDAPSILHWTSLNTTGLNSLETVASGWDARSNSFASAFQDNATSIGQLGRDYMHNVWAGDGNLALMDDAPIDAQNALSWVYLQSQRYMFSGSVGAFALDGQGNVDQAQQLQMVTNWQGNSVQPVQWVEVLAIIEANPEVPLDQIDDKAVFKSPAATNPYRQGDVVLAGQSTLYETFVPNWSDRVTADGYGTLELVPVLPFSDANTIFTAVNIGSSTALINQLGQSKPHFWDSLMAASWDLTTSRSAIWYRDPVVVPDAPATLGEVDKAFLEAIELKQLATTEYPIGDVAYQTDSQGQLQAAYWVEVSRPLLYQAASSKTLYPDGANEGAALVIYRDGELTRLPYATTSGLNQLVQAADTYGPTAIEIFPANESAPALLVIGGEHGLFAAELDQQGMPGTFSAMNIDGLAEGVQLGSAVTGIEYNAQDDLMIASMLGNGSLLFSRTGDIGATPTSAESLHVSQTIVQQALSENLDKRGNPVQGGFVIELGPQAFDDNGMATVEFVIDDADLWRSHLDSVTFYLDPGDSPKAFDLLDRSGTQIIERLTFHEFADMRLGNFQTRASASELPPISLPYTVNLLDGNDQVIQTVQSSIDLMPNGATPVLYEYDSQLTDRKVFQAQFGYGDGVEFQKLPFVVKTALPATLAQNTELFLFEVDDTSGLIELPDGSSYLPTDPDYLQVAVPAARISSDSPIVSGRSSDLQGLDVEILSRLFGQDDLSGFLATEEVYFGDSAVTSIPLVFDDPEAPIPPLFGMALRSPDGTITASTVSIANLTGNQVSLISDQTQESFVIDVGYGGLFAAQHNGGDIQIAKLGGLASAVGFVRVDDLFGTIDGIAPDQAGYVVAALDRSLEEGLAVTLDQGYGSLQTYQVDGFIEGTYYASFITPGYQTVQAARDALADNLQADTPLVLFSFDKANTSAQGQTVSAAIPFANDVIAFEDMPVSGDLDFNDIVIAYGAIV
ncbi:DUF4114 domain-containing protein [Orrella daihaiensis]|uniref:DUF4114 domain-containing protein n=1 Tax=Orrella daihaiensis TaxID=2782176 RepID=A0ABY4AK89_9BURK|nr:DUF4114 domain-containing protein [Orrella daihaiensis]UOD50685.1 DUF4114 domain-containing protein [Orrella daihaiensis]